MTSVVAARNKHQLFNTLRNNHGKSNVMPRDIKMLEPTLIPNERLEEHQQQLRRKQTNKETLEFSKEPLTLAEALQDPANISEGIKITELKEGDSLTFEKKAKVPEGMKKYRLKDYKNMTKDKSFREFKSTTRKSSLLELSPSPNLGPQPNPQ